MSPNTGISRRDALKVSGSLGVAYIIGAKVGGDDGEEDAMLLGGGGGGGGGSTTSFSESGTFGDWEAVVTNDFGEVTVESHPTLVYHTGDASTYVYADSPPYSTTIETFNTTMEVVITSDPSSVTIETYPTLMIDKSANDQHLFTE